jgi:hypothetical protein
MNTALEYRVCTSTTRTGYFKCREVKTGFYRNKSMQTGSSGTLIGWKSGQTTFVPLWDRMEGAWLRTQYKSVPGGGPTGRRCKKSTLNDLVHLTPLRIPLMNPPSVYYSNGLFPTAVYARVRAHVEHIWGRKLMKGSMEASMNVVVAAASTTLPMVLFDTLWNAFSFCDSWVLTSNHQ